MTIERNSTEEQKPESVRALFQAIKAKEARSLLNMDFPTLDELEMDIPILNAHMRQARVAPEDEEEIEVQCMLHFDPSVRMHLAR